MPAQATDGGSPGAYREGDARRAIRSAAASVAADPAVV